MYYGFSAFFLPLQQEFQVNRTAISGAASLAGLEGIFVGPFQGMAIDRFGPRRVVLVGVVLAGAGFVLLSRVDSILQFYLVYITLISFGVALGLGATLQAAVANWFIKKRGLALGITMSGIGLGGVLVSLVALVIDHWGWRNASLLNGLAVWAVGAIVVLLVRDRPEKYGLLPDGASPRTEARGGSSEGSDYTAREALRTSAFWLTSLAFGLRIAVGAAISLHFIPAMVEKGFSSQAAAAFVGAQGLASVPGRFGFGWVGDRWGTRYGLVLTGVLVGASLIILVTAHSTWQIVLFLLLYAPANGGGVTLIPALRAEYFGRKAFATISGIGSMFQVLGGIFGPLFAGRVFDATQSYRTAFVVFALLVAVSAVLSFVARPPGRKPVSNTL